MGACLPCAREMEGTKSPKRIWIFENGPIYSKVGTRNPGLRLLSLTKELVCSRRTRSHHHTG